MAMAEPNQPLWKRILAGRNPRWTLIRIVVLSFVAVLVLRVFVPVRVTGTSMQPTYADKAIVVINRLSYLRSQPERGDVVAIRWAGNRAWLLKRVVGLPGEKIEITRNSLHINGQKQSEPHAHWGESIWNVASLTLGPGEFLVIGDNRDMLQSEHEFGRVERERIVGKVFR